MHIRYRYSCEEKQGGGKHRFKRKNMAENTLKIGIGDVELEAELFIPDNAHGIVVFSNSSHSRRLSQGNRFLVNHLQQSGFATMLFRLLSDEEDVAEEDADMALLTDRLINITDWLQQADLTRELNIGYLGESAGAAAALRASAAIADQVGAVVSIGGPLDLAAAVFADIRTPVLLLVGGLDEEGLALSIQVQGQLQGIKDVEIVPDAHDLFQDIGKLEMAAQLATDWYRKYLKPGKQHALRQDQP